MEVDPERLGRTAQEWERIAGACRRSAPRLSNSASAGREKAVLELLDIAKTFENMFNIDLGDFYHSYLELKGRKINRTKFLDSLRDALIKRMDEQDEK